MRIVLTGATGFVGRHCIPLLAANDYEIHALSSRAVGRDTATVRWHRVDLTSPGAVSDLMARVEATHLLHLAWYTEPRKYWNSLENLRWVQASLCLLQEFAQNGGQRVVMAGTCAEYDWRYGYCSEAVTPLAPSSLYGIAKHSVQLLASAFSELTGLSMIWGRVFYLFGPHEHPKRLLPYVIRSISHGQPARCSRGDQLRDFLYVEDAADAFVTLLKSEITGPINIASGNPVPLGQVICTTARLLGRPGLVELGAVSAGRHEPRFLVADVGRLRDELQWHPQFDLELGLRETIRWWRQRSTESGG